MAYARMHDVLNTLKWTSTQAGQSRNFSLICFLISIERDKHRLVAIDALERQKPRSCVFLFDASYDVNDLDSFLEVDDD